VEFKEKKKENTNGSKFNPSIEKKKRGGKEENGLGGPSLKAITFKNQTFVTLQTRGRGKKKKGSVVHKMFPFFP